MADNDCWGAFGSDSDSDEDDKVVHPNEQPNMFEPAADATALAITQQFVSSTKSSGVLLKERVVGIDSCHVDEQVDQWKEMMAERVVGRGVKVVGGSDRGMLGDFECDAAILLTTDNSDRGEKCQSSYINRALLPGGSLWLVIALEEEEMGKVADGDESIQEKWLKDYSQAIWDVDSASVVFSSSTFQVISMRKRHCVINAWSCPWMNKRERILSQLSTLNKNDEFLTSTNETYLEYERNVASAVTISPSIAERTRKHVDASTSSGKPVFATVLTDANVQRATAILQKHGLVVIKGLLPPAQTIPWGEAVQSDFESAVARLRCHPTRPVDLMNPHVADTTEERVFEPLSYKEMAMREDLRVDLRSGPEMENLRLSQNDLASHSMAQESGEDTKTSTENDLNDGPSMVHGDTMGTVTSWRYHPSILAITKATFNPRDDSLFKGNFGRWNFGGSGPDGSPQPFRLGQIGSVLSCPGSGDQAVHADTPHLFEHVDCLPCHYLNVFTPGYNVINDSRNNSFQNEFHGEVFTGNSTIGGTAFVHGSHKLSVSTELLSEDGSDMDGNVDDNAALIRRQSLQLRTLRPALDAGDVVMFDCRTIHYGLANTSEGDKTGKDINAARRPMLYLNITQSWFHDPKNWSTKEKIFD
mmetsp:Transcript_9230/g.20823  ORF Transcript_9230/g.20823 Transcript_9230/m.20823 type:complete len:644 (-) Transcript_9230:1221-3152(-)|eukprot:CAMPEP_0172308486 /NCGR_PEP_ID=MMETSP1058-20130122/9064_1 /TAXON_ID=83371 /ORGANISM="Detonula confervacea, Strain CCMP 353" /LENGTH=643 /DNA_ID=CAMNT_0013020913 /DNA_START=71 /DNA_END=2002 /DNA_ORIENTATION=+